MPQNFNQPVHAFRGFAILNIVTIHAFGVMLYYATMSGSPVGPAHGILDMLNGILLHDSTLYFTFISGILFSMVLAERGFARFFQSKFLYVFLPYLVFTTLYSSLTPTGPPGSPLEFFDGTFVEFVNLVAYNLFTGKAILIFWYIPVLICLYLLTPLLARLLATPGTVWLQVLIICLPLFVSRTATSFSLPSVVYFLGAYLVGMIVGTHYRETIRQIEQNITLLIITAVVTTLAIAASGYFQTPNYGVFFAAESAWYLQKLAFGGLVLLWFDRTITVVPKWLDVLANYAFALYFIHIFLIFQFMIWMTQKQIQIEGTLGMLFYLTVAMAIGFLGSLLIAFVVKFVFRKYSRYAIGA